MMIESNVIKRSKYENSSLKLIPGILRSLQDGQSRWLSIERIKKYMMLEVDNSTQYDALLDKLIDMLPSYKTHWKSCIDLCRRPDCVKESHVTIVHSVFGDGNTSPRVTQLRLYLYPPNDQTTIVTSQPKMNFVDFLTQIISCISFWFGFCPLQLIDWMKRFKQRKDTDKDKETRQKVRRLEHHVRRLEHHVRRRLHLIERTLERNHFALVE
jgi:hypothetical protein